MPPTRPPTTGYERLAQADALSSDSEDEDPLSHSSATLQPASAPRFAPITQPRPRSGMVTPKGYHRDPTAPSSQTRPRPRRRVGSGSGVDLKAINARLERWADEIASRFKRSRAHNKQPGEDDRLEIHHSVFQPPEGVRPLTAEGLAEPQPVMKRAEFEEIVGSVRTAIAQGVHPRMISQGSSGSYFARNPDGKIVGVFKPKDEEPYAAGNPKWNKWIHRNLFPCCFGRACLIPNLSYVSEAAAYTLDCQLRTHMVPYTEVVNLSSKSFHYPFWDRRSFSRKKKALPEKAGSFQVFLTGFKDANIFLREHPWPDQYWSGFRTNDPHRKRRRRWADNCRPGGGRPALDDVESDDEGERDEVQLGPDNFVWTDNMKQSFREELEKLVILDYIMRNTDRGLDNWMIKVDWQTQQVSVVSEPVQMNMANAQSAEEAGPRPVDLTTRSMPESRAKYPSYETQQPMKAASPLPRGREPRITVGAIDNSLSWPWKHPDAWRSFPFGWLFLPVDLIGRPFSQKTRDHFLPLLTSTQWWSETALALRKVFQVDPDFQEKMFARQMAVMKGQAWNVVETLKLADHGPLELTRRAKVCVWDDLVDIPVAFPMRMSSELRRRGEHSSLDEGDIGVAAASAPVHGPDSDAEDLLGFASPPADMPHPGRFEMPMSPGADDAQSPVEDSHMNGSGSLDQHSTSTPQRPRIPVPGFRESYHGPSRSLNVYAPQRQGQGPYTGSGPKQQRRYSFATAATRRSSSSIAQQLYGGGSREYDPEYDGDDVEGDLGYAAAEGMEGNHRKVIVERLEPVKARNPVFTCW
ncbi:phosphatidyl inositol kinase [Verticillium nonalfalfae]|uniref:Phosphatidylinositol 4-kinase n=1 Tax=Verticillium nonalfalfae TaxID=1051616 RepID=A0A3M9XZY8_9PEZI|nr:phosphatidyl inositol kinase [Verticillium nonalfalfae]RNJ53571.1 phosphatidyl inositol kinase [Verticillium nonalfalfae]